MSFILDTKTVLVSEKTKRAKDILALEANALSALTQAFQIVQQIKDQHRNEINISQEYDNSDLLEVDNIVQTLKTKVNTLVDLIAE